MRFLFVVLPSLMVLGCATYVPPPPPLPPPPKPVPTVPQWTSKSDNTAENFDCLGPTACPRAMVERARRRAAIAFKCPADQISTTPRPAQGLSYWPSTAEFTSQGNVQIAVNNSKPADAFDVSGCGQKGILVCVWANRSVRTPDKTYENTADRLCLWADALQGGGGR